MTKASDNQFPKVTFLESAAPATPGSGLGFLYEKTDNKLYFKNDAGTETELTAAGSATVPNAHGARVKRASGNFSVGNNTYTAIQFDAEDFDTDAIHDNSTQNTRLTIPTITGVTTGLWSLSAGGYTDASSGRTDVKFRVNNTTDIAVDLINGPASVMGFQLTTKYVFTAADYVECFVRTSGGSFNVVYDAGFSPRFEIAFLGKVT